MKNRKLKMEEFKKYSLSKNFKISIKGGAPVIVETQPNWDPNNPQNGTGVPPGPGTTTMNSGTIKPDNNGETGIFNP